MTDETLQPGGEQTEAPDTSTTVTTETTVETNQADAAGSTDDSEG